MTTKKRPEDYLEHRRVRPGFSVALDALPNNHAVIIATCAGIGTAWEYNSITAALQAWLAWDPTKNDEPQGFVMRRDASSKVSTEVL